uniref:Uncharacterized protein n=1 Tax=Anguilla anguilla TaxID=7936 RepID=A0A0E9RTL9_ANGAN
MSSYVNVSVYIVGSKQCSLSAPGSNVWFPHFEK